LRAFTSSAARIEVKLTIAIFLVLIISLVLFQVDVQLPGDVRSEQLTFARSRADLYALFNPAQVLLDNRLDSWYE
jgi:hypothetical protein